MTAPRLDMYRQIHKALRAAMSEVLLAAGRMDPHDDAERSGLAAQIRDMLAFARLHLQKEDRFVHPALEARAPGSSGKTAIDHLDHAHAIAQIEQAVTVLEQAGADARQAAADTLYSQLALFVGENFVHMQVEETANNAIFWRTYSDGELAAIELAIVASLSPQEKMFSARWMLPWINPAERAEKMSAMRQVMPPEIFAGLLAMVRQHISPAHAVRLDASLNARQGEAA